MAPPEAKWKFPRDAWQNLRRDAWDAWSAAEAVQRQKMCPAHECRANRAELGGTTDAGMLLRVEMT
eukprot:CAMPEP_0179278788 /NCGR_PEP_ID=MMETSP0797-20121207/35784_1 /TAXON_ID=47934 /ORGANISM="Dinophysis acuminata, Strain DAEP01" /LENGTH=65 /DNA_ID=CAMNT_0020987407 /DNA_START=61 /DNA_END=255 /DNA_ORIENTATION=+